MVTITTGIFFNDVLHALSTASADLPFDPRPGGIPALHPGDPRTMISVLEMAILAVWANEFSALR
jgi:hypothetical protein